NCAASVESSDASPAAAAGFCASSASSCRSATMALRMAWSAAMQAGLSDVRSVVGAAPVGWPPTCATAVWADSPNATTAPNPAADRDPAATKEWEQLDGERLPMLRFGNHAIIRGFDRIKIQQLFGWVGC